MSSPKHLWSGDWERESKPLEQSPAVREPEPPTTEPESPRRPDGPRRRPGRQAVLAGVAAVIVLAITAGVVVALTVGGNSSTPTATAQTQTSAQANPGGFNSGGASPYPQQTNTSPTTVPQTATTPQTTTPQTTTAQAVPTTPVSSGTLYNWLGMQLSDSTQGPTVVTVTENSAADQAGVDPGDIITAVNTTSVGSMAQVRAAVAKLKTGQRFQLTINRGSTVVTVTATLTGSPTRVS